MVSRAPFAALERVARLRADLELKKFAAFRCHVAALEVEAGRLHAALMAEHAAAAPCTAGEMRLAHACTRQAAEALLAADAELRRLDPAFETARTAALRAFGRAEALAALGHRADAAARLAAARRVP